jgi:hypothetical protein
MKFLSFTLALSVSAMFGSVHKVAGTKHLQFECAAPNFSIEQIKTQEEVTELILERKRGKAKGKLNSPVGPFVKTIRTFVHIVLGRHTMANLVAVLN